MIISALAIFQAWIWMEVGICKFLFDCVLKTFLPQKEMFWVEICI
jgi:hypothetical protein